MNNLVFITGDFSSGSTLLFNLFRRTGEYYSLYEPLHEKFLEYLIWPPRVYEHHFFLKDYYSEFRGFDQIPQLFKPHWGNSELYLPPGADADDLHRYLTYLFDTASKRRSKVMMKENRLTFRLGWIREKFPDAKVIHIYRDRDKQWNSIVKRAQLHLGRSDAGQDKVSFMGMSVAAWCEDLKNKFPELSAGNSSSGYERFCKLWELSYNENRQHADISIDLRELTQNYESVCRQLHDTLKCESDFTALKELVVPADKQKPLTVNNRGLKKRVENFIDKMGSIQARLRVRLRSSLLRQTGGKI